MPPKASKQAAATAGTSTPKPIASGSKQDAATMRVTLVSGFLGSGKTTLLQNLLTNREGLRCAVIVNEISTINIDAFNVAGMKLLQANEKIVEMSNGCICCTLREDLLLQLRELAESKKYDCVVIESSGIAEPMQVAETFFVDLNDGHGTLHKVARLDNCITVVDASTLKEYLEQDAPTSTIDAKAKGSSEDRSISQLLMDQLEFANVVMLNKCDMLGPKGKQRDARIKELTSIVRHINPTAQVIATERSQADAKNLLNTGFFTVEFAMGVQGWMDDIKTGVKHVPETIEYHMSSFVWGSERAFHPQRLHAWMTTHFVLNEAVPTEDHHHHHDHDAAHPHEHTAACAKPQSQKQQKDFAKISAQRAALRKPRYGHIFRSKGFVWIANPTRLECFAVWSQVGGTLTFGLGGEWTEFPEATTTGTRDQDPCNRIVFIGQDLKRDVIEADLNACLLTDAEEKALRRHMNNKGPVGDVFPDPFAAFATAELVTDDDEEDEEEENPQKHTKKPTAAKKNSKAQSAKKAKAVAPKSKRPAAAVGKKASSKKPAKTATATKAKKAAKKAKPAKKAAAAKKKKTTSRK